MTKLQIETWKLRKVCAMSRKVADHHTRSLTLARRTAGMTQTEEKFKTQANSQRSEKMQQAGAAPVTCQKGVGRNSNSVFTFHSSYITAPLLKGK